MWILTAIGFVSVVRKPGDTVLTIRAEARKLISMTANPIGRKRDLAVLESLTL